MARRLPVTCGFSGQVPKDVGASFALLGGMTATDATACSSLRVAGLEVNEFVDVYQVTEGQSIQAAIDRAVAAGATSTNPALVLVGPGTYGAPLEPSRIRLSPGVHVAAATQGQLYSDALVSVTVPMYLDDVLTAGSPVVVSGIRIVPTGTLPAPQAVPVWLRSGDLVLQNVLVGVAGSSPDSVQVGDATFAASPGRLNLLVKDSNLSGGLIALGWATVTIDPTVMGTLTSQTPTNSARNTIKCVDSVVDAAAFTGAFNATFTNCQINQPSSFSGVGLTSGNPNSLTFTGTTILNSLTLNGATAFGQIGLVASLDRVRASGTGSLTCANGMYFNAVDSVLHSSASFTQPAPNTISVLVATLLRTDYVVSPSGTLTANYCSYEHKQGTLASTSTFNYCGSAYLDWVEGRTRTSFVETDDVELRNCYFYNLRLESTNPSATATLFACEVYGEPLSAGAYTFTVQGIPLAANSCNLNLASLTDSPGQYRNCSFGIGTGPSIQPGVLVQGASAVTFDNCRLDNLQVLGSSATDLTVARVFQSLVADNGATAHAGSPILVGSTGSGLGTRLWLSNSTLLPSVAAGGTWLNDGTASPAKDTVYGAGLSAGAFPPGGTVGNTLAAIVAPVNPTNVTVVPLYFA